eukprot:jgi/Botrbrau1/16128/Bobra.7_2s0087.1
MAVLDVQMHVPALDVLPCPPSGSTWKWPRTAAARHDGLVVATGAKGPWHNFWQVLARGPRDHCTISARCQVTTAQFWQVLARGPRDHRTISARCQGTTAQFLAILARGPRDHGTISDALGRSCIGYLHCLKAGSPYANSTDMLPC